MVIGFERIEAPPQVPGAHQEPAGSHKEAYHPASVRSAVAADNARIQASTGVAEFGTLHLVAASDSQALTARPTTGRSDAVRADGDRSQTPQDVAGHDNPSPERQALQTSIDRLPAAQREAMNQDMDRLEGRAKRDKLSPDEVAGTYREVNRLLTTPSQTHDQASRQQIAGEVLALAANPEPVNQGPSNTCTLASMESKAFKESPSQSARLVADVVLNGRYQTNDTSPRTIEPDIGSITEHFRGASLGHDVHDRTMASQIFQVTAANVYLDRVNQEQGGHLAYEQRRPTPGSTNERIVDRSTNPPTTVVKDRPPTFEDGLTRHIDGTFAAITGKRDETSIITPENGMTRRQFDDKLQTLSEAGQLPVSLPIVGPDGNGGHTVRIEKYDQATHTAEVRDPRDPLQPIPVPAGDLYRAMHVRAPHDPAAQQAYMQLLNDKVEAHMIPRDKLVESIRWIAPPDREMMLNTKLRSGQTMMSMLSPEERHALGVAEH